MKVPGKSIIFSNFQHANISMQYTVHKKKKLFNISKQIYNSQSQKIQTHFQITGILPGLFYAMLSDGTLANGIFLCGAQISSREIMRLHTHHSRDSRPWTHLCKLCSSQLPRVWYSLEQRLFIYITYIRKKSLKICRLSLGDISLVFQFLVKLLFKV